MPITPDDALRMYNEAKSLRSQFEPDWKNAVAFCQPYSYAAWNRDGPIAQNAGSATEVRRVVYDSTGVNALPKYKSILQRIATPDGTMWSQLRASNADLMRIYAVKQYFDDLSTLLHTMRYNPRARFKQACGELYGQLGVIGTGPVRVSWRQPAAGEKKGGLAYKAINMRNFFIILDDDGNVWMTLYRFWQTASQFRLKWPDTAAPPSVAAELSKGQAPDQTKTFEFVHIVYPRPQAEYDAYGIRANRFTHCSLYLSVGDKQYVGAEGGYNKNPYLTPRTETDAEYPYGISPAQLALPALGGASATKKTLIKQGQKAVDPVILANDDGVLSGRVDLRPGRVTYGGIDNAGRQLVKALEMGNFQPAMEILDGDRSDAQESFFVDLFKMITENQDWTIPQLLAAMADKAAIIAPTMGRLQSEFLGPDIEREIACVTEYAPRLMPPMPPELKEAQGEYEVLYTSPLAKGIYADEDAGYVQLLQLALQKAEATGDQSDLDLFENDVAIPNIADHKGVPVRWMASPDSIANKRDKREKQEQARMAVQAAPAAASVTTAMLKNRTGSVPGVTPV